MGPDKKKVTASHWKNTEGTLHRDTKSPSRMSVSLPFGCCLGRGAGGPSVRNDACGHCQGLWRGIGRLSAAVSRCPTSPSSSKFINFVEIRHFWLIAQGGKKEEALAYLKNIRKKNGTQCRPSASYTEEGCYWTVTLCALSLAHLLRKTFG